MAESDSGNEVEVSNSQVEENVSVAETENKGAKKSKPKKEGNSRGKRNFKNKSRADNNEAGLHHENLLTKVVSFDQKSYYLDLRENSFGKYLKLTEVSPYSHGQGNQNGQKGGGHSRRSTILLSPEVLNTLQAVLNDSIKEQYSTEHINLEELDAHWVTVFSRRVQTSHKKLYIDLMQNQKGRSINIAEVHQSRPKTAVVISERGWFSFKRALDEIQKEVPDFAPEAGKTYGKGKQLQRNKNEKRKKDSEGADNVESKSAENHEEGGAADAEADVNRNILDSKKISIKAKRFFFDFLENDQGRYVKMAEVRRSKREVVRVPKDVFPVLINLLDNFINEEFETEVEGIEQLELPTTDTEDHTTLASRSIDLEELLQSDGGEVDAGRKYTIDLRENKYGRFLRFCEHRTTRSNCVFFPSDNFQEIRDILQGFQDME
mmetsp:Transcript_20483/g.24826  ORF Transcript_20483/g.24826 Transcript_20483/m.24826 type:complete len:434 (+) Transcript_20483:82-1383(+)|eukprot:CAMPEP_0204842840 /NCGR_PEP_ID=MMETSP1346-20131115/47630_1 /ASSEMBLY_ACC=CAM_ASM_000771 /TAXON_ID=215587 /ORGANISM="Aplanochytrium stocchinoi, Strain GSBS06" /LENGTH=433 /DNA_ID=CAMNT_0051981881 /DNA_START=239 /DNA_END=1540 /DNA_ORIENTATION=+